MQVIQPKALPSLEMIHLAHDPAYVSAFLNGSLSDEQQRRIGLSSLVNENIFINRTLWEVSGVLLSSLLSSALSSFGCTGHFHPST
jgi:hypothetical protein